MKKIKHSVQSLLQKLSPKRPNSESNSDEKIKQLLNKEEIPNTPFTLVKTQEGYFITMGKYRLSQAHKTKEKAIQDLTINQWHHIATIAIIMAENIQTVKEEENKRNQSNKKHTGL